MGKTSSHFLNWENAKSQMCKCSVFAYTSCHGDGEWNTSRDLNAVRLFGTINRQLIWMNVKGFSSWCASQRCWSRGRWGMRRRRRLGEESLLYNIQLCCLLSFILLLFHHPFTSHLPRPEDFTAIPPYSHSVAITTLQSIATLMGYFHPLILTLPKEFWSQIV